MLALGCLPDPTKLAGEPPDWRYGELADYLGLGGELPQAVHLGHLLAPALDQQGLGSCVAQVVAQLVHASHVRQGLARPELLSRLALYYLARASHRGERYDSGTSMRAAFRVLNRFGYCAESAWPHNVADYLRQPPPAILIGSYDQSAQASATAYWRIDGSPMERLEQIMGAIAGGFPVGFGIDVSRAFASRDFDPDGPVGTPGPVEQLAGGHAMVIGGYRLVAGAVVLEVLSSWGPSWGVDGWIDCRADWICDRGRDMWLCEHAPVL